MARIRTIKPEFPQSESIGKLSRDARLLYIQLWTIVDDAGRTRAASRMLASLLYPYDDEARELIDGWLLELERGDHILRYDVDGSQYLEICKWLEHQKIDRPSPSRLPEYREPTDKPREPSRALDADLVPRTVEGTKDHSRSIEVDRRSSEPDRFEEFWKLYPRREGPNPRKPAETRFKALVKTGLDAQMLIDEVRKFAALDETRRQTGSRFIPQAVTWLNQQRWSDHAAVAFLADDLPREMSIECALAQFARIGSWSRFAPGTAPGEPGCVATAEQLAAAGLDANGRKLPSSEAA